jgi:hypothetical protein
MAADASIWSRVMTSGGATRITFPCQPSLPTMSPAATHRTTASRATPGAVDHAHPPNVADHGMLGLEFEEFRLEISAVAGGFLDELLLLHDLEYGQGSGAAQGIAARRRGHLAALQAGDDGRPRDQGGDGHAAADALAQDEDIGLEVFVLEGPHRARPAEGRLDLVEDEEKPAVPW